MKDPRSSVPRPQSWRGGTDVAWSVFLNFINGWGAFLIPLVLVSSPQQATAPMALYPFIHVGVTQYGLVAAFSLMFSIPVIVLYLIAARWIGRGLGVAGAVQG